MERPLDELISSLYSKRKRAMRGEVNPNGWSCLPTSFAMILDVSVNALIQQLGHDGSQIVWPELPDPHRRRGFNIQELIDLSWSLGFTVTPFEARPTSQNWMDSSLYVVPMLSGPAERLGTVMAANFGVITGETLRGKPHSMAWDGSQCHDPDRKTCDLSSFKVECFWAIKSS